jgi:hypothetical protein
MGKDPATGMPRVSLGWRHEPQVRGHAARGDKMAVWGAAQACQLMKVLTAAAWALPFK